MLGRSMDLRSAAATTDPLLNTGASSSAPGTARPYASAPPTPSTGPPPMPSSSFFHAAYAHQPMAMGGGGGLRPAPSSSSSSSSLFHIASASSSASSSSAHGVVPSLWEMRTSRDSRPRPRGRGSSHLAPTMASHTSTSITTTPSSSSGSVLMELIIEDYLPPSPRDVRRQERLTAMDTEKPGHARQQPMPVSKPRESSLDSEGPIDGGDPMMTASSASSSVASAQSQQAQARGGQSAVRDRSSLMQRMRSWKKELWDALTSVDKHVKKRAEEDHRELSDGEKKHSVREFKHNYMPTREAARAVLDPRYAGHCLGTDINKLACESLLSDAPTVLKSAVDKVPQKLDEVITLSSNLLDELIEQAKRENATGDEQQGVRLHKFLEFYKGYKERSLRTRMERLKERIQAEAATLVQDACSEALAKEVLHPAEQSCPTTVVGYHQLLDTSLPRVPLAAAQAIHTRVTDMVGRALAEVDEIQAELLPPMPDAYASLAHKLRQMVIEDEPRAKKPRSDIIDLTGDKDNEASPRRPSDQASGMDEDAPPGSNTSLMKRMRRVPTLVDLCISLCADYVDYLPEMPDGCFPDDLLQRMFTLLIQRDVLRDDTLHRLMSSTMTTLDLHGWKRLTSASCDTIARRSFISLRRLNLSGCTGLLDEGLQTILNSVGRSLEHLSVEGCIGLTDNSLQSLSQCSNLLSLELSCCSRITDAALKNLHIYCSQLTVLHLRKCPLVTDQGLSIVSNLPNLKILDLWENVRLTDRVLLAATACICLETVRVCGRGFSDVGVRALASSCSALKAIDIAGASLSDVTICTLLCLPKLIRLSIPHCSRITDTAFTSLPEGLRLETVEEIDLSRSTALTDDSLRSIALHCPRLQRFSLAGCELITDTGLTLLASRCSQLTHISLAQCKKITNVGACALIRAANTKLLALSLENCHNITDEAMFTLAQANCTALVDLDLSGCDAITDEGLRAVVNTCPSLEGISVEELTALSEEGVGLLGRLSLLKRLRVGYAKGVTDGALADITSGCQDLQSLDLSYCVNPGFTEAGIETALSKLPDLEALSLRGTQVAATCRVEHARLTSLNLSWCKTLHDAALERLAESCPSLRHLDLAWCDQITGAAVHKLAQRLAALRSLNLRGCHKIPSLTIQFLTHAGKAVQR